MSEGRYTGRDNNIVDNLIPPVPPTPTPAATQPATPTATATQPAPSEFSISVKGPVVEGGDLTFIVKRVGDSSERQSVTWATTDGTAKNGADYVGDWVTTGFREGETEKEFTVQTLPDGLYEGDESFTVALSDATGGAVISRTQGSFAAVVTDDDPAPTPTPAPTEPPTPSGDPIFLPIVSGGPSLIYLNYVQNSLGAVPSDSVAEQVNP